ncbi:MAG: FtsX-like permease family protein [Spirochaetales bacterium]|nr:FtsX-like permease family protein [Spirochaetales bacterium]
MKLYKIAFRNISRNKRRSILSGTAIAIAAMIITILISLYAGIGKDMKKNIYTVLTGHIRIRHNEYDVNEALNPLHLGIDNYKDVLERLENTDNVEAVNPRISFGTAFYGSPRLFLQDVKDWDRFITLLTSGNNPVFSFLKEKYLYVRERLARKGTQIPDIESIASNMDRMELGDVLYGINEVLERYVLYDPDRFAGISLSEETLAYTERDVPFEERILFNRLALQDAFPGLIIDNPRSGKLILGMGMGMDFQKDAGFMNLETKLESGGIPQSDREAREIILSSGLAKKLNASVGDRITISTKTKYMGMNGITVKVTGIVDLPVAMYNTRFFFLPLDTAQNLLKMDDSVIEILILLKDINKMNTTVSSIKNTLSSVGITNLDVRAWDTIGVYPAYILMLDIVGYYVALFFFLLGSTVIITTTIMVVYERMREIGTVAAMGMKGSQIVRLFFLESFFIGAIASIIGVLIGSGIVIPLGILGWDWSEGLESADFAMSSLLKPAWSLRNTIIIFVYSTAIASIASFFPARRAAKIQPVEALRAV